MSRKKKREEHLNHEAWAIPYGDLVTLLMAFFVVMYAVSVVDAGKYRVLSNSLVEAFGSSAGRVKPIQIGEPSIGVDLIGTEIPRSIVPLELQRGVADESLDNVSPANLAMESVLDQYSEDEQWAILREIGELAGEIEAGLGGLIADELIQVKRATYWLEIEINTSLLFGSASATLEPAARPVLSDVARILAKRHARIHVEGHTDNLPIRNPVYPSNWELSSGRAATVVNLFAENGVDPERMVAIGYAEFQPVTSNATPEGRAQNRRVAIIVLPGPPPRSSESVEPERLRRDYHEADQAATERSAVARLPDGDATEAPARAVRSGPAVPVRSGIGQLE